MNHLANKKDRELFYQGVVIIDKLPKLDVKYVGVFRIISGLLDLWENYAVGYFTPKGKLLTVATSPSYKSMDGEYRAFSFKWDILQDMLARDSHIQDQIRNWAEANQVEFHFQLFTDETGAIPRKIQKICDTKLMIDVMTMSVIPFYLMSESVFYRYTNNWNTRLIADFINTDFATANPSVEASNINAVRGTMYDASNIFRTKYSFIIGQKSVPIAKTAEIAENEIKLLLLTNWLKARACLVHVPTYLYASLFSNITGDYFMNQAIRDRYKLGYYTNKMVNIYLYNIACSHTTYFYFVNFNVFMERGGGQNLVFPQPDAFNFYILDWIYNLTSIHLNMDTVHMDLHLNNFSIGRNLLRAAVWYFNQDTIDAGIQYVIDKDTTLYLPVIDTAGFIFDFSRAVYMGDWAHAYDRIAAKIPEIRHLTEEESKTVARFYDFEFLIGNIIEGMRTVITGRKKTLFDNMPKKVRDKLTNIRKTLEDLKKEYFADDSELPREFYPGKYLLKHNFTEFVKPYKLKKLDIVIGLELSPKDKIEFQKYRKKVIRLNIEDGSLLS